MKEVEKKFLDSLSKIPAFEKKKFLVAVSGGLDSMVLSHLFHKYHLDFEWAHCNFKLRGKESDDDEIFIRKTAESLQIPLHINICPVDKNQNTQLAARKNRYKWFEQLKNRFSFDYIVTAHHFNDATETFFINLLRGSGIKGLTGIPQNNSIIRPLLWVTREEIANYAKKNNITWREDSSNRSDKYLRNKIRRHLMPVLKEISPDYEKAFAKSMRFLKEDREIIEEWFDLYKKNLIVREGDTERLSISGWRLMKHPRQFLYHWLSPYHFSDWDSIYSLPGAQTGKFIENKDYTLVKHGDYLILAKKQNEKKDSFFFHTLPAQIEFPQAFGFQLLKKEEIDMNKIKSAGKNTVYIDFDKVKFPLIIRKKQKGDYFYPLGMKGKKKLSDFFKDEKLSLPEKEKIWLFCDANNIMWISGKRLDDRYKINKNTKKILKIEKL